MIMYSYKHTIAITNGKLYKREYLEQIEKIAAVSPAAIILREKELDDEEYFKLAKEVIKITEKYQVKLILHSHIKVAKQLDYKKIHLPLYLLKEAKEEIRDFDEIGVSIHSVEEAVEAESLGATYITAGHIFWTDCKRGMEPRGLEFLENIINNVHIPVYAIGGINEENANISLERGAEGVCMMSVFVDIS